MIPPKLLVGRAVVDRRYAVLPPEGWLLSALPGWSGTEVNVLCAPAMGADFVQYMLTVSKGGGASTQLAEDIEGFFYVISGSADLELAGGKHALRAGGFAFMPPGAKYRLAGTSDAAARITFLRKRHEPLDSTLPPAFVGNENDIKGNIYMGLEGLLLRELIPADLPYDMAMNIFTFQPGWSLPIVETHVMEHGLIFLQGQGLYYLGDRWFEVQQGDFIWMGPYCPQSFYATGQVASRYIYYKNVNRDIEL